MSSWKPEASNFSRNDGGFTLLEIMAGLVILSLIGVVVWQGVAQTGRLLEKVSANLFSTVRTVQVDQYLREEASRIKAPYWMKKFTAEESDGQSLAVPYLEGDADHFLVFEYRDEYLLVGEKRKGSEDVQAVRKFGPFKKAVFETMRDGEDKEYGIKFSLYPGASAESVEITARYGSHPF